MAIEKAPPRSHWQGPLLVGICLGLGYGITQRLLGLQLPAFVQLGQGFELRQFPGTSLDSLRLRFGAVPQDSGEPAPVSPVEPDPLAAPLAAPLAPPQSEPGSANLEGQPAEAVPQAPNLPVPQLPPPDPLTQP